MNGKITLITPPDFFENDTFSLLFINLNEQDQELVSDWFAKSNIQKDVNIYFYTNETNVDWLLYAYARCNYRFINLDNSNAIIQCLSGYFLGKRNSFYKLDNENLFMIYNYINQNRIINIETFLEKAFDDQINPKP